MPLQNRVDPFGEIHAVSARGMFTGNRGVLHDPDTRTLLRRRWTTQAWIVCDCGFKNRKREIFGRTTRSGNAGWTNLFFLDEVTALAAGHRPCFYCRRAKAKEFVDAYAKAFGLAKPKITEIDRRLHAERLASGGHSRVLVPEAVAALPDGAMIADGGEAYARRGDAWRAWSFDGYGKSTTVHENLRLLTPPATLAVLCAGYRPEWHSSADH